MFVVVEVWLHSFLTSTLDSGESSASRPGIFTSRKDAPVPIEQEAGWAPRPGLEVVGKLKISCLSLDLNSRSSRL
jgi:hypothetical protein